MVNVIQLLRASEIGKSKIRACDPKHYHCNLIRRGRFSTRHPGILIKFSLK